MRSPKQGKSARETERVLLAHASRPEQHRVTEKIRPVSEELTELKFTIDSKTRDLLERVKELKGNLELQALFAQALSAYLEKIDPAKGARRNKSLNTSKDRPRTSEGSRYVSRGIKRELRERSKGRCEFVDSKTGHRCASRMKLEVDHRIPFAKGGPTTFENCQLLCPTHNRLKAIEEFGQEKMRPFLKL